MKEDDDARQRAGDQINDNLKRVYRELVEDEVPDRFKNLLEQLRAKDAAR